MLIDILNESTGLPVSFSADGFNISLDDVYGNIDNEDMPEDERNKPTGQAYVIYADGTPVYKIDASIIPEEDAWAKTQVFRVYDDLIDAIQRGDSVYSFRRSF